ncbi:unnamed protein product [Prunus armeniaca]|uniref:RNase H type-1 domain-containing protein n=1 Tax=Prunus armeniaca TaxID=36596 RepID=A0A6J5V325_PRUAR|nr:unnamed protein product [Prunus armeniaca]
MEIWTNGMMEETSVVHHLYVWMRNAWIRKYQAALSVSNSRAKAKWQKTPLGANKINVDGAFQVHTGIGGGGIIARYSAGCFVAARACKFNHVASPEHAETLALREALLFAQDFGPVPKMIEKIHARGVLQSIQDTMEDRSQLSCLFSDCKFLLSQLENVSIQFDYRETNQAAHRLARLALTLPETTSWLQDPPDAVCDVWWRTVCNL